MQWIDIFYVINYLKSIWLLITSLEDPHISGIDKSHLRLGGPHPSHASFTTKFFAYTCVGTLPRWEPMWQYLAT